MEELVKPELFFLQFYVVTQCAVRKFRRSNMILKESSGVQLKIGDILEKEFYSDCSFTPDCTIILLDVALGILKWRRTVRIRISEQSPK